MGFSKLRICKQCSQERSLDSFPKSRGCYEHVCKSCKKSNKKLWEKTKRGVVFITYLSQKKSSKRRGHIPPTYTKYELEDWLMSQPLFHELYNKWVLSGYDKWEKPSVDRIDDDVHYCFTNIQLTTWRANQDKAYADIRSGKLTNKPKRK